MVAVLFMRSEKVLRSQSNWPVLHMTFSLLFLETQPVCQNSHIISSVVLKELKSEKMTSMVPRSRHLDFLSLGLEPTNS